jgi:hypothetical protein
LALLNQLSHSWDTWERFKVSLPVVVPSVDFHDYLQPWQLEWSVSRMSCQHLFPKRFTFCGVNPARKLNSVTQPSADASSRKCTYAQTIDDTRIQSDVAEMLNTSATNDWAIV